MEKTRRGCAEGEKKVNLPSPTPQKMSLSVPRILIHVHVSPNARQARVTMVDESNFEVRVDEIAADGRANKRLMELLSQHFNVPKSNISIIKGAVSRDKIVQVIK